MNPITKSKISNASKVLVVIFTIAGALRTVDFISYGHEIHNLVAGVAFALMAYGIFKNGLAKEMYDPSGRTATVAGAVLMLCSIPLKYIG